MKNLIFVLPLTFALITACNGANTPANATQPTTVSGTIAGYSGGAASIDLKANSTIATGSVNTSGAFTVTLPAASTLTPYLSTLSENDLYTATNQTCTGSLTNSNSAARVFGFDTLHIGSTDYTTIQVAYSDTTLTATISGYLWLYTDRAATLSGTKTCTGTDGNGYASTTQVTYTVPLKVGWNLIKEDASATAAATGKSISGQVTYTTVNDQATVWTTGSAAQPLGLKNASATMSALVRSFHLR